MRALTGKRLCLRLDRSLGLGLEAIGGNDGTSCIGFLDRARERAEECLALCCHIDRASCHNLRHEERGCRKGDEDKRQEDVVGEHHDHGACKHRGCDDELEEPALQDLGDLVEVVRRTRDRISRLVCIIVGERKTPELVCNALAELEVETLCEGLHDQGLEGIESPGEGPDAEVGQNLLPAITDPHDIDLSCCKRSLDVLPDEVHKARRVGDRPERSHHIEDGRDRCHDKAPPLVSCNLPETLRGLPGVLGHLLFELFVGKGKSLLLLFILSAFMLLLSALHLRHLPSPGTRQCLDSPGSSP